MSQPDESTRPPPADDEIPPPIGTIFFVTVYLMAMAGMWGAVYILMLQR